MDTLMIFWTYVIICWGFGIFYTMSVADKFWTWRNIKLIIFASLIFTPIVLLLMGVFYLFLGFLNLLEKVDSMYDR